MKNFSANYQIHFGNPIETQYYCGKGSSRMRVKVCSCGLSTIDLCDVFYDPGNGANIVSNVEFIGIWV